MARTRGADGIAGLPIRDQRVCPSVDGQQRFAQGVSAQGREGGPDGDGFSSVTRRGAHWDGNRVPAGAEKGKRRGQMKTERGETLHGALTLRKCPGEDPP